jgi:hypothetical protein
VYQVIYIEIDNNSYIDLSYPGHGKTLINSAGLDQSNPDDLENAGSFMEVDFSGS